MLEMTKPEYPKDIEAEIYFLTPEPLPEERLKVKVRGFVMALMLSSTSSEWNLHSKPNFRFTFTFVGWSPAPALAPGSGCEHPPPEGFTPRRPGEATGGELVRYCGSEVKPESGGVTSMPERYW